MALCGLLSSPEYPLNPFQVLVLENLASRLMLCMSADVLTITQQITC